MGKGVKVKVNEMSGLLFKTVDDIMQRCPRVGKESLSCTEARRLADHA